MSVANRTSGVVNEIAGSYTRGERINLLLCIWLEVVTNGLKARKNPKLRVDVLGTWEYGDTNARSSSTA